MHACNTIILPSVTIPCLCVSLVTTQPKGYIKEIRGVGDQGHSGGVGKNWG